MVLQALARRIVDDERVAPAAVIAASVRRGRGWETVTGAAGRLSGEPGAPEADATTPFDLASVTKPVLALTVARLVRAGVLGWSTPLGELVPAARGTPSEGAPLEALLSHRAGLDGHRPLYAPLVRGEPVSREGALAEAARARRPECPGAVPVEGFPPVYSDLGYLLLGAAVERACDAPLDEVYAREVTGPLAARIGSARRLRGEMAGFDRLVAATEVVDWRGGVVRGAVHDENAWAIAKDAACGHAGLFGTAHALVVVGQAILDALAGRRDDWLRAIDVAPLVRVRPGGTLRAGFDSKSGQGSSAGDRFGPRTVGHLGFTGTSLWVDPDRDLSGVLLTNRVHPTRAATEIRRVRPIVYDAIADWADAL